jgi:hypothetical protein
MERETGIEPATNSLEGCDSTTELLPPVVTHEREPASARPNNILNFLELMMGLEPMTSPLPRECSTTELHQPCTTGPATASGLFILFAHLLIVPRPGRVDHYPEEKQSENQQRQSPDASGIQSEPRQRD